MVPSKKPNWVSFIKDQHYDLLISDSTNFFDIYANLFKIPKFIRLVTGIIDAKGIRYQVGGPLHTYYAIQR